MSEDWYAENLRLTFFGVMGWAQRPIFTEVTGMSPAQINAQPPIQIYQEMGNLSDAYLAVTQQAGRIDIVLTDQPARNTADSEAPGYKPLYWIGPFRESIEAFDAISAKATSLITDATRVAYAITLIRQTESVHEAVGILHKFLPTIDFDPDNDTDLVFQINRPTRDKSDRIINRLGRWEAIQTTTLRVSLGVPSPLPSGSPIYAARIYVDISTDANNKVPFAGSEVPELVDTLRTYAIAVAENGDRK
jgi:hypothetical protein